MKGVLSLGLCGSAHATNLRRLGVGGGVGATALVNLLLQLVHVTWFPLAACFRARRHQRFSQSSSTAAEHRSSAAPAAIWSGDQPSVALELHTKPPA